MIIALDCLVSPLYEYHSKTCGRTTFRKSYNEDFRLIQHNKVDNLYAQGLSPYQVGT